MMCYLLLPLATLHVLVQHRTSSHSGEVNCGSRRSSALANTSAFNAMLVYYMRLIIMAPHTACVANGAGPSLAANLLTHRGANMLHQNGAWLFSGSMLPALNTNAHVLARPMYNLLCSFNVGSVQIGQLHLGNFL